MEEQYEIFISYSSLDQNRIENTICKELEAQGIKYFLAGHSLEGGTIWKKELYHALRSCNEVFVIISPNSRDSEWVKREIDIALYDSKKIIPFLHRCSKESIPDSLGEHHFVDLMDYESEIEGYLKRKSNNDYEDTEEKEVVNDITSKIVKLIEFKLENQNTVYDFRSNHYRYEKELLGKKFSQYLGNRVRFLRKNKYKKIKIFFDSGTTIAPILDELAKEAENDPNHWTRIENQVGEIPEIEFYTNSIRGVQNILKYKKIPDSTSKFKNKIDRFFPIPFDCYILPGKILSPYEAIADVDTIKAILGHKQKEDDVYIITITTGNYFLGIDKYFSPIARTGYHPEIKAAYHHIADENYLITPLGKIIFDYEYKSKTLSNFLEKFNKSLHYEADSEDPSLQEYKLIDYEFTLNKLSFIKDYIKEENEFNDWMQKTILVTTSRIKNDHFLFPHFQHINDTYNEFNGLSTMIKEGNDGPFILSFPFDDLPFVKQKQIDKEVPHRNLRSSKKLLSNYFNIEFK